MKPKRRWMKWIVEADTDKVELPWDRKVRQKRREAQAKKAA